MTRQNMDHYAARAGRPRRRDLRFDAWNPPVDGIVDAAALRDLLLRTDLYERVGDPLSPEGIVACVAGLSGLLQGGGTCRLFLTVPIVNPDGLWDRRSDGARTNAALRFALEHTWADPEARDALDLLGYLVSRGRASLGMCLVPRSDPSAADLRTYGHPYEGWAIARDGDRRFLLLPDESGAHRVVARDDDETAVLAARSFENLWSDNHPKPYTDGIPPSVLALIRDRGERNARPREPGVPSSAPRGKPYAPMEVLRFALLRDAPMMPGGRLIGVESAPVAHGPTRPRSPGGSSRDTRARGCSPTRSASARPSRPGWPCVR